MKAFKSVAIGLGVMPIAGCAIGTGIIFHSLLRSLAYAPDIEDELFTYAMLGFGLVETFAFFIIAFIFIILIF